MSLKNSDSVVFVVVEGIPNHEGKILMIQEKNKPAPRLWKLVGGTMENGETLRDTACREVFEETGILIHLVSDDDIFYEAELKGSSGCYNFVVLKGRYYSGEVRSGKEIETISFFTPSQIKEMIKNRQIVKNHAEALKCFL